MLRALWVAAATACVLSAAAEARPRSAARAAECNVSMPCEGAGEVGTFRGYAEFQARGSESLYGVVHELAAKAREIQSACGARVISAVRKTYIAGTRRVSLHASGRAVDMAGNPACIYRHLASWPGGYSTDYGRVRHVHISYDASGGREWGLRFVHGGARKRGGRHRR